jgi:CRP/FNR family transcriptional activator FtrB
MRDEDLLIVRKIPLFSTMSDEHFDALFKLAYLQHFPNQVQLITEGDHADFLHVVVEGTVELFSRSHDRETTMFVLRAGSVFNVSAILQNSIYLMSARTLDNARVLLIPADNVRKTMDADYTFARAMVKELANRYGNMVSAYKEHRLRSGVERLANFLLRANAQQSGRGKFELSEDRQTLAALLGMTPEYLSRALSTLKEYGVEVKGRNVSLTKLKDLKRFAKPNPLIDDREN